MNKRRRYLAKRRRAHAKAFRIVRFTMPYTPAEAEEFARRVFIRDMEAKIARELGVPEHLMVRFETKGSTPT